MKIIRLFILLVSCSIGADAADLSRCLSLTAYKQHRLEKEDLIRSCFNQYKLVITKETCHSLLTKKVSKLASTKLSDEINALCFYDTTPAKDMNACLKDTKKFKSTANHDEAVFYCYQQFQDKLTQNECLKTADQLIYPLKKEYLQQHCNNNSN